MRLDAYELLGVPRLAMLDETNCSYRAAARTCSPGHTGGTHAVQHIQQAGEMLRDRCTASAVGCRAADGRLRARIESTAPDPYVVPLQDI